MFPYGFVPVRYVRPRVGLQQGMVFQISIHVKSVQWLTVEAGQKHIHYDENVQPFAGNTFLDSLGNIRKIAIEIIRREICAECFIVILHDALQAIARVLGRNIFVSGSFAP